MFSRRWVRASVGTGGKPGLQDKLDYPLVVRQIDTAVVGTSGGTGYNIGDTVEPAGTTGVNALFTVATLSGSAIATVTLTFLGAFSDDPTPLTDNPVVTLTGGGSGALLDLTMADN